MAQTGSFIQIINVTTDRYDELKALDERWKEETASETTAQRITVCKSLDGENQYSIIVEFPNYASAMQNSENPKTQEMSEQMQKLCSSIDFENLEVLTSETV